MNLFQRWLNAFGKEKEDKEMTWIIEKIIY